MVAGLNVGSHVYGVCSKVLAKGDYGKGEKDKLIAGKIIGSSGQGKQRKWSVQWDKPAKTSLVGPRRLSLGDAPADQVSDEESSAADSHSDEDDSQPDPKAVSPTALDPHGLHWEPVESVKVDSFQSPKRKFFLSWPNDLPIENRRAMDYFMLLFPISTVPDFIARTNSELEKHSQRPMTKQEFFKFIGILYCMGDLKLADRREYWSIPTPDDLFMPPNVGRFGIGQTRFETILRYLRFGDDTDDPWTHPRALINAFNENRIETCQPSWRLCVDEKMSAYRPRKGAWCDDSIPHLTKIIRKPEGVGTELKDVTDGATRVTMGLELQEGKLAMGTKEYVDKFNAGTAVLLRLCKPWFNSNRVVCGDSAFASVEAAIACQSHGLHFSGLVKTASRKFPKKYLTDLDLPECGQHAVVISNPSADVRLLGVAWNGGKKRKLIVSTCGVTTLAAEPAKRTRYVNQGDGTSLANVRETPWPSVVANYFQTAPASDINNHLRQGSLGLE